MNRVLVVFFCLIELDCEIKMYVLVICEFSAFEVKNTVHHFAFNLSSIYF